MLSKEEDSAKYDSASFRHLEVNRRAKTKVLFTADVVGNHTFIITMQTKQLLDLLK